MNVSDRKMGIHARDEQALVGAFHVEHGGGVGGGVVLVDADLCAEGGSGQQEQ